MLRSKVKVITISSGYDVVPKEKTQLAWKKKQQKKQLTLNQASMAGLQVPHN